MKTLLAATLLAIFAANSQALTPAERVVVLDMQATIAQLRGKIKAADNANAKTLRSLAAASSQLQSLKQELASAERQIQQVVAERDALAGDLEKAKKQIAHLNKKYQRAQFIIASVVALLATLIAVYFTHFLKPPYNLVIPAAAAAAAFAVVYIIL
jgi:septal ring factor EnvC (AmiA/AmiB activator)